MLVVIAIAKFSARAAVGAQARLTETRLIEAAAYVTAACVRLQLVSRLMEVAAVFGKLCAYFPLINGPNKAVNKTFFLP